MKSNFYFRLRALVLCMLGAAACPAWGQGKPWVEDFPAFASTGDGTRWIVGRSTLPCVSENEAFEAATRDARAQLLARVRPLLGQSYDNRSEMWLQRRLAQDLVIVDRSVSRVHRPYGDIWSESLLVDAPHDRLSRLAREHAIWRNDRRQTAWGAVASVAGLSITILLIYTAINAATKGYFRGRLRAAAALTLALGLLAALYAIRGVG
jgi:hypothetical protein